MKISKRSLHYRFLQRVNGKPPADLCRYMRDLVGWSLLYGVVFPLVVAGMIELPIIMYVGKVAFNAFIADYGVIAKIFAVLAMALGLLAWVALVLVSIFFAIDKLSDWRRYKPDTLLTAWVRAQKEKVCPIIEFTE